MRDIAFTLSNQEMLIDLYWAKKDWDKLALHEGMLKKSNSLKYWLYYIYLIIHKQNQNKFDDIFKDVISLAYKEWD